MEIKLTIARIIEIYAFLDKSFDTVPYFFKLSKRFSEYDGLSLPGITNMKLSFIKKKLQEITLVINDSRLELIKKYGVSQDGGETYNIPQDKVQLYVKELNVILLHEKKITFDPFKLSDFEGTNIPMEVSDMLVDFVKI